MSIQKMEPRTMSASALVAAEIRAELARQGLNQTDLGNRLGRNRTWVSMRLKAGSGAQDLRIDEIVEMAKALNVSVQGLLSQLPRLDSNQQPSGYLHTAPVWDLFTRERVA